MRYAVTLMIISLLILHQDNWLWDNPRLLGGFLPVGLAYHICISLGAACTWFLATQFCWPHELEAPEDAAEPKGGSQ